VGEPEEQFHDLRAGRAIKVAGRFVGQNQGRIGNERTRQRHALLLAAGKFKRHVAGAVGQPHLIKQRQRALAYLTAREVRHTGHGRKHDVLGHVHLGKQVVRLEDETDLSGAQRGAAALRERIERLAIDTHLARVGPVKPTQNMQQRAFARTAAADDGDALALGHM